MSQIVRPKSYIVGEVIKSDEMNAQFDTIYNAFNLLESKKLVTDEGYSTSISSGNINDIKATGFYAGSNITNAPTTGFYRIVSSFDDVNSGFQLAIDSSNQMYSRICDSGIWGSWVKIIKDERGVWTAITGKNGWVSNTSNPAKYRINGDRVELRGMVEVGTKANDTTIFNLPSGYRPKAGSRGFSVPCTSSPYVAFLYISADGNMKVRGVTSATDSSSIRLDGIYFDIN